MQKKGSEINPPWLGNFLDLGQKQIEQDRLHALQEQKGQDQHLLRQE